MNLMNRRAMSRLLTVTVCVALMGAGCGRTDEAAVPARQAAAVHVRMTDIQQVVAEVVEAMQQDPALAVIDQPFRVIDANGYNVGVAMIRRTRPEAESLLHEQITEVYYILDGAGTLTTGGMLVDPKPPDSELLALVGPGATGAAIQGGSAQRVSAGDLVIIPTGTPHMFTALDGTITYIIIRIDTGRVLSLL